MKFNPHPGYEVLWNLDVETDVPGKKTTFDEKLDTIINYHPPKGMEIYDAKVPGLHGAPDVPIRVFKQPGVKNAPLLLNIHGGGFVSGGCDRDNPRTAAFAWGVPCTVVSVEYRLAPKNVFPAALEDCCAVLAYAYAHPAEFGVDRDRIAVLGTSAGGAIAASLCLYVRDHGGPKIAMQVLNFPTLDYLANTKSVLQLYEGAPLVSGDGLSKVWGLFLGGFDGTLPSYYAVPALARDLAGLPPACVVTCEYDPLRDEGIDYARRLMEFAVPTELYSLPRVPHGFDLVPAPMTHWIREGIYNSLRREFGML
jgi:acetyl esterase